MTVVEQAAQLLRDTGAILEAAALEAMASAAKDCAEYVVKQEEQNKNMFSSATSMQMRAVTVLNVVEP